MTCVLIRRDTDTQGLCVMTKAEAGLVCLQASSPQQLEEARGDVPLEPSERARPSQHEDLRLGTSGTLPE